MIPEELAAIHRSTFTVPRPWSASEIKDLLASHGVFPLTQDNAFLLGRVIADEAELLTLAVDPKHQRKGHGASLTRQFIEQAAISGAATAFLEVAADNDAAIALYTGLGFEQIAERPNYYHSTNGASLDAKILRRDIPTPIVDANPA